MEVDDAEMELPLPSQASTQNNKKRKEPPNKAKGGASKKRKMNDSEDDIDAKDLADFIDESEDEKPK